jgi:hypothetical protein
MLNMHINRVDPVIETIRYAFRNATIHRLKDIEAAIYAAAFVLYPAQQYLLIAKEAAFYSATSDGKYVETICEASKRRIEAGTMGSMSVSL